MREGLPKDGPHANSTQNPSTATKNVIQEDVQCASTIEISKSIPRPCMEPNAPSSLGDAMTSPVAAVSSALPKQGNLGGQSKLNTIPSFTPNFYTPMDLDNDGVTLNQMPIVSSSISLNSPARSATSNTVTPSTPAHHTKECQSDSPFETERLLRNLTEGKENPPSVERNDSASTSSKSSFVVSAKTISNYKRTIKRHGTEKWNKMTELERKRLHTAHAYFETEQRSIGPNASSATDTWFLSSTSKGSKDRPKRIKDYIKTIKKFGTMSWDQLTGPERKNLHKAHYCLEWERVNRNKSDSNSSSVKNTGDETNVGISNPTPGRFVESSAPSSLGKAITDPPVSERYSLWESFLNNQGNVDAPKTTQQRIGGSSDSNTKTSLGDNVCESKSDAASNQSMKKKTCNKESTPNIHSNSPVRSAELTVASIVAAVPPKTPVQKQNIAFGIASSSRQQEFPPGTVVPLGYPTQCQTDSPIETENLHRNPTEEKNPQNVDKNDVASPSKSSYFVKAKRISNYKRTIKRLGTKEWDSLTEPELKRLHAARVFFEREGSKKNSPYAGLALDNYFRSSTTNFRSSITKTISNYRRTIRRYGKKSWDVCSDLERKDLHSAHLFFERERSTMETNSTPTPVRTAVEHAPTITASNSTPRPCLEPYAPSSLGEGMADLVIGKRYTQSGSFLPNQESSNAQKTSPSSNLNNTSLIVPNFYTPRGPNGDGMPSNEVKETNAHNKALFQGAAVPFDPFQGIRLSEIQQRRHRFCVYRPWGEILVLLNRGGTKAMLRFKDQKKVVYIDKDKQQIVE